MGINGVNNIFLSQPIGPKDPRFAGVGPVTQQPISTPKLGLTGNPFAKESLDASTVSTFGANANNGLSGLRLGALGEEAVYTKKGRLGASLNGIA